ncbi:MAG: VWA domain-containing protein [Candidatus Aminicenantes bacterium]|nr:VWA domain-containing protein [Candidatus Aminicenantes bacterium]
MIILFLFFSLFLYGHESNSASAFSRKTADQEVLKYEVGVTLKLVQVYVMDSHGTPVTDLKKEDFELYDNGKLQLFADFEKRILFTPLDNTEQARKEGIPNQTKFNRKFFLFFDLAFNSARGIKNAKEAALYFIDHQVRPSDEVGVLSYSATKYLTIHENLTTNHKKVKEAVEGIGMKNFLGRAEDVERRYWGMIEEMARPENSGLDETEKALKTNEFKQIGFDRLYFKQQVIIFSRTMKELGQALSHIQGRKDILYLSTGIPSSIFEGDTAKKGVSMRDFIFQDAFADIGLNDRYDEMIRMLAASNSSIYPLYAEGTNTSSDPSYGFQDRQQLGKSSLQRMAAKTGGKYFGNIQDYGTIMEEIQNATSSFYVLGYYIGETWDGKYHEIAVKTKRKGCVVQAQAGYFNPKPFSELTALEKKMDFLELALEGRSQFLVSRHFPGETMHFATERISGLVTLSKIPAAAVQELSGKQVEIVLLIFDEKDDLRHFKGWRVDFTKLPQKDIFLYSLASLPPGTYKPRIVIRNTQTGKSIVSSVQAGIQEPADSGLKLSSPLLLVPEKGAAYLKGERIKEEDKDQKTIDLTDLYPCNFNLWTPVVEEMERGQAGLTAVVRSYVPECQYPDMIIFPRLMDQSTGGIVPLPFSVSRQDPENHSQISFITFQSEQLKPGNYILHFDAEETWTGLKSSVSAAFSIK